MKLLSKHIRSKQWDFGTFYILPTIAIEWHGNKSTMNNYIHLEWFSYRVSLMTKKRKG